MLIIVIIMVELIVGGWWLVVGDWWLVVGGRWLVIITYKQKLKFLLKT